MFVVIEYTPGYMPDEDDPAVFEEYAAAVMYMNEKASEFEEVDDGFRVVYGAASSDNLAAVLVYDDNKTHDLGRVIAIQHYDI